MPKTEIPGKQVKDQSVSLTVDVSGLLPINNGGTGQARANAALNALLPSQTGNSNKLLQTDGTNTLWATPASVHVYRQTSTQSISALTYTKVNWNGEDWDTANEFDLTTDRYTATTAGKRLIICSVYWTSAANKLFEIVIYKNSNLFKVSTYNPASNNPLTTSISAIIDMAVNDYIEIYVYQEDSGTLNIGQDKSTTFLCIQK